MKKIFLLLLVYGFTADLLQAQTAPFVMTGVVYDSQNQPLPHYPIFFQRNIPGITPTFNLLVYSDENGIYQFPFVYDTTNTSWDYITVMYCTYIPVPYSRNCTPCLSL
ncbi:MAG: hypothetical protein AAF206_28795, partial [Bacteroidota bacterium]